MINCGRKLVLFIILNKELSKVELWKLKDQPKRKWKA